MARNEKARIGDLTGFEKPVRSDAPTARGELPEGWELIQLSEVVVLHNAGIWGDEVENGRGFPVLRSTNMRGGKLDFADVAYRDVPTERVPKYVLSNGDILVTKSSGSSRLVGMPILFKHPSDEKEYLFSNFTHRLRVDSRRLLPEFALGYLLSPQGRRTIEMMQNTTTGLRNLDMTAYLTQEIPLPPLPEQRRIVARIEEFARRAEVARGLRREAAVWVQRITESYLAAIGSEFSEVETRPLGDLLIQASYGTSVKCNTVRTVGAIPILRIPNVASEKVSFSDLKYGQLSESEIQKSSLREGDILIVRTNGSINLVGRCAAVPTLTETMGFASYLIRLRCNSEIVEPGFLQLVLRQKRAAGELTNFARTTAGQYNVSLGRLNTLEIPIPPLDEQRRIVACLDRVQAKADAIRAAQAATQQELDALMPSVLAKAFAGEL